MLFIYYKDIIILSQPRQASILPIEKVVAIERKSSRKRKRIGNGTRNTKSVHTINDYMLEWVVRQAHPFFRSTIEPANITIYVAKVQHFSRQSLSIQAECFRWHFCDEINMVHGIGVHKQTKSFSNCAPRQGTKKKQIHSHNECTLLYSCTCHRQY